ncbi:hypothetical protein SteCoe_15785 [Stentor coeruleus]|uniref:Uncharacterized protein n=1 Tax=Stentor coeruleus TaxID=5963 RepID=A0A1R2C2R8_9CILI|nr:hypothetical protein SteCoe_15785 [Stentor coeruleus]
MALHLDFQLKTKSEKTIKVVKKELEKYSPRGASKSPSLPKLNLMLEKKCELVQIKEDSENPDKYNNYAILDYIKKLPKPKDIHIRDPYKNPCERRQSTLSPKPFPLSPTMIKNDYQNLDFMGTTKHGFSKDLIENKNGDTKSPILDAVNNIIESCNEVFTTNEKKEYPEKLKKYSTKLTMLGDRIDNCLEGSRRFSKEQVDDDLLKDLQKRLVKDFYGEDGKREMIETEFVDKKIKRKIWKNRGYSVPKHIDYYLKQHTRFK